MPTAYIVEALRTARAQRGGALREWRPADLGAAVLNALVTRSRIDPGQIEDVIVGCVSQVGEQSFQIGRNMVLASSPSDSVPAVSIDRQCGSSQQALHFAAQAVMSGTQDVVIAAGVEHMTRVPMESPTLLAANAGLGTGPWPRSILDRYGVAQFSQFTGAEMIASNYGFSRDELDEFALASHRKAIAATEAGAFEREIVVIDGLDKEDGNLRHANDEGIRRDASKDALAAPKTFVPTGVVTAGNASQVCDGASAVLVVSAAALKTHGLTPIARVEALAVTAGDPVIMLMEPIPATRRLLNRAGRPIDEIDLFEINEAFAPVPLAWLKELGADPENSTSMAGRSRLAFRWGQTGPS